MDHKFSNKQAENLFTRTSPSVLVQETKPFLEAVAVQCINSVSQVEQDIIEERLKGGN